MLAGRVFLSTASSNGFAAAMTCVSVLHSLGLFGLLMLWQIAATGRHSCFSTGRKPIGLSGSQLDVFHLSDVVVVVVAAVAGALEFGAGVSSKSSLRIHSVMAIAVIVASSSVAT